MVCKTSKVFWGLAKESTEDLTLMSIGVKIAARFDRGYISCEIARKTSGRQSQSFINDLEKPRAYTQQAHRRHCRVEEILKKVQALIFPVGNDDGKKALNRLIRLTAPIEPTHASLTVRPPNIHRATPG